MIKVEVKNGLPHIDGRICSYETKEIRSEVQEFAEVNKEFILPKKYTYVVTELNGFAKIIKAEEQALREKYSAGVINVSKDWLRDFYEIERELLIKEIERMLKEPVQNPVVCHQIADSGLNVV